MSATINRTWTPSLGAWLEPEGSARSSDTDALVGPWEMVLTSEDPAFSPDLSPPDVEWTEQGLAIRFLRPSAVVLRREGERKLT